MTVTGTAAGIDSPQGAAGGMGETAEAADAGTAGLERAEAAEVGTAEEPQKAGVAAADAGTAGLERAETAEVGTAEEPQKAGVAAADAGTAGLERAEAAGLEVTGTGDGGVTHGEAHHYEVVRSDLVYRGRVIAVRRDMVAMPDGDVSQRDVVVHPGAVGVVALDDGGRVVMVRQYRHPVGGPLWELPAGILDVPGEPASRAAARELAEEANLAARDWQVLADVFASPGMADEAYRLFLARGLSEVPASARHVGVHEEAEMATDRVDLDEAVARVFRGEITNAMAVIGILAAARAQAGGFTSLRSPDTPWPARPGHAG